MEAKEGTWYDTLIKGLNCHERGGSMEVKGNKGTWLSPHTLVRGYRSTSKMQGAFGLIAAGHEADSARSSQNIKEDKETLVVHTVVRGYRCTLAKQACTRISLCKESGIDTSSSDNPAHHNPPQYWTFLAG
eukprot:1160429-Pelagomonas_calceolata.AAC.6